MITQLHIENFKSLADFDFPPDPSHLGQFTCVIGLNGSGKSTLLQAFDFLGQLAGGKMEKWLEERHWKKSELTSNSETFNPLISFKVVFQFGPNDSTRGLWRGVFDTVQLRCIKESIWGDGKHLLRLIDDYLFIAGAAPNDSSEYSDASEFDFTGSVLSLLKLTNAHAGIVRVKEYLLNLKSLELLAPNLLRRPYMSGEDIGMGGEKLAPFLYQLAKDDKVHLFQSLQKFYPQLAGFDVKSDQEGWKWLEMTESYSPASSIPAAHLNDGLLRIIAILGQAYSPHGILLFDEIENGINPELVEKLVNFLLAMGRQVIVTTHSPMILNYLPDEVANEAVVFLYKLKDGSARCIRFFDIPEMQHKLQALGPGEVFVDTNLTQLADRLAADDETSKALPTT